MPSCASKGVAQGAAFRACQQGARPTSARHGGRPRVCRRLLQRARPSRRLRTERGGALRDDSRDGRSSGEQRVRHRRCPCRPPVGARFRQRTVANVERRALGLSRGRRSTPSRRSCFTKKIYTRFIFFLTASAAPLEKSCDPIANSYLDAHSSARENALSTFEASRSFFVCTRRYAPSPGAQKVHVIRRHA